MLVFIMKALSQQSDGVAAPPSPSRYFQCSPQSNCFCGYLWLQVAMREACKYIDEKLATKVTLFSMTSMAVFLLVPWSLFAIAFLEKFC
jgi:hypothetical protein